MSDPTFPPDQKTVCEQKVEILDKSIAPVTDNKIPFGDIYTNSNEINPPVYAIIDIETTGLSPWAERITCIGVQIIRPTDGKSTAQHEPIVFTQKQNGEIDILAQFWNYILQNKVTKLVGWNLDGFDWPFIKVRSAFLNVPLGNYFHKYSERIDLMSVLKCGKWQKLETAAQVLFGEGKIAANPVILWHEDKIDELKSYNMKDVELTARIFQRCIKLGILGK